MTTIKFCHMKSIAIFLLFSLTLSVSAVEIDGKIGLSGRLFQNSASYSQQHNQQLSLYADLELYHAWNDDKDSILFKPYARLDQHDDERTHADIRELVWLHVSDEWELRSGIAKVFWGVNEGNHLVDIINQDDMVDDISGDQKLGQPMINLSLLKEWGTVDFFVLPFFRQQTFPGEEGRLRSGLIVDTNQTRYESDQKENHVDFALRWSHSIDAFDIGLHYFKGTNRTPRFILQTAAKSVLIPYYDQISQFGADIQATYDGWLLKLEMIQREDQIDNFFAASGGFEYTINGIVESNTDLGIIVEYSWDERNNPSANQFQNDFMMGLRFAFNDADSSEILAGVVQNIEHRQLRSFQIEASRRFGENTKVNLEIRLFNDHYLNPISQDDHIQLSIEQYF